jgi:IS5 family transposase
MIGKSSNQNQRDLFKPLLKDFVNLRHELILLSEKIDWSYFENTFNSLYSNTGQPAMPMFNGW